MNHRENPNQYPVYPDPDAERPEDDRPRLPYAPV